MRQKAFMDVITRAVLRSGWKTLRLAHWEAAAGNGLSVCLSVCACHTSFARLPYVTEREGVRWFIMAPIVDFDFGLPETSGLWSNQVFFGNTSSAWMTIILTTFLSWSNSETFAFSAVTLLVGRPACKKYGPMRCWRGCLCGAKCKWFAYSPADATATPSSRASTKSRMVYPSGTSLPRLSWKKRPLNSCVYVYAVKKEWVGSFGTSEVWAENC